MILINNLSLRILKNRQDIDSAIERVLNRSQFVLGPEVTNFESNFAKYLSIDYCVSCANGTDAIELALRTLNLKPQSLVGTVANAGGYTTNAILATNTNPYFMDVDSTTRNVTLVEVEKAINNGVSAIVVTHLFGLAVSEIREIANLCKLNNVPLIEDCAQAHGAKINSKHVGTFGDISTFSFYPTKNLGALGDGGAITTNNSQFAKKLRRLRQYGWIEKYHSVEMGSRNSRLDEMQAAILSVFLPQLDLLNSRRRKIASIYSKKIRNKNVKAPAIYGEEYVAHLYVIGTSDRKNLRLYLESLGIQTDIHYPIPDHRQPVFGEYFKKLTLKNTEQLSNEILTLPCYPEMSDHDVNLIVDAINSWNS